jgi:hypothetical protein
MVASSAARFFVQLIDLSLDTLGFFALLPDFVPIRALASGSGVDDLDHVFTWVLILFTLPRSIGFEIVEEGPGVPSDISEVHRLTTLCQE